MPLESVKFYNTFADKIPSVAVSIADKIYTEANFAVFSTDKTSSILHDIDRVLWTFSSPKFIPHLLSTDEDYKIYKTKSTNINLLCSDVESLGDFLLNHKNITLLIINNNLQFNFEEMFGILQGCTNIISVAMLTPIEQTANWQASIQCPLQLTKQNSIPHEIWQNFDFGWEKMF